MFGWHNTRTEQVTRSAVTSSGKYIWVEPTFGSQLKPHSILASCNPDLDLRERVDSKARKQVESMSQTRTNLSKTWPETTFTTKFAAG